MKTTKNDQVIINRCKKDVAVGNSYSTKMKYSSRLFFILLALTFLPSVASAERERYVLDFDDTFIRSYNRQPATLFLKRTLREQYPNVNMRDLELKKVVLVAKTRMGRGGAELRVGSQRSYNSRVHGRPPEFKSHSKHTFDRVQFRNPAYGSKGPWQLDLWGNFKVRKVVLVVEERDRYRPRHHGDHQNRGRNYYGYSWQWR